MERLIEYCYYNFSQVEFESAWNELKNEKELKNFRFSIGNWKGKI